MVLNQINSFEQYIKFASLEPLFIRPLSFVDLMDLILGEKMLISS